MSSGPMPSVPGIPPKGLLLAMDTAGAEGSLAVGSWRGPGKPRMGEGVGRGPSLSGRTHLGPDGPFQVLAHSNLQAHEEHASLLLPRIQDLLAEVGAGVADLSGVLVGAGPGSFTGVRVGAATAKGLAWALGIPMWAFSSLAGAAAAIDEEPHHPRVVLFDARGDRVYAAAYRIASGSFETLLPPKASTLGEILDELFLPEAVLIGDGALRHRALLEGGGYRVLPAPAGRPDARGLLKVLSLDPQSMPVADLGRWEPDYLRDSGAERMRKARPGWTGP